MWSVFSEVHCIGFKWLNHFQSTEDEEKAKKNKRIAVAPWMELNIREKLEIVWRGKLALMWESVQIENEKQTLFKVGSRASTHTPSTRNEHWEDLRYTHYLCVPILEN